MKKIFLFIGITAFILVGMQHEVKSQIIDGAYKKEDIKGRKPTSLPFVREADVMWHKRIWRIIDLREKMNQPMYFPTHEVEGRYSLINLLLQGIKDGKLTAYDARSDDEFKNPINYEQVKEAFGATTRTKMIKDIDTGELKQTNVAGEIRSEQVKQFLIKEDWYFDKQSSTMNVRIIGICPIQEYYRDEDANQENVMHRKVFWVNYSEARELMAASEVFNPQNTARNLSFDDVFLKRKFNSYITQEENIYNNRAISQYMGSKEAMIESKRIEHSIFDYEQNLWEY